MAQAATVLSENELWDKLGPGDYQARAKAKAEGRPWELRGFHKEHELYKQTVVVAKPKPAPKPVKFPISDADYERLHLDDRIGRGRALDQGKPWEAGAAYDKAFRDRTAIKIK